VTSYVTGGGGAQVEPVSHCTTTDAYAVGWSYSSSSGSACGTATRPTKDSQVFHFLKVTVNGTTVTVNPINALGQSFDSHTFNWTTPASVDSPRSGTTVYEERNGNGISAAEVHPGV